MSFNESYGSFGATLQTYFFSFNKATFLFYVCSNIFKTTVKGQTPYLNTLFVLQNYTLTFLILTACQGHRAGCRRTQDISLAQAQLDPGV